MRKSKGFTLIELLAVIVILAIIALIAVPVILNVIEKSKIGAAEQSAQGYVDAVEKQIVTNKVKNENLIEEGEYTKSQLDEKNVKIKGEITDAVVVIGEKGQVTQGRFCINGYSIDYDGKKATKNSEATYCTKIDSIVFVCPYEVNQVFNFEYTGNVQTFTAECDGKYKLEVWGAEGGSGDGSTGTNKGGYTVGTINLTRSTNTYVYVGQQGDRSTNNSNFTFGGGGRCYSSSGRQMGRGGGASDIRINEDSLYARVIVAGGGGGSDYPSSYSGGAGGGLTGITGNHANCSGTGGTISAGGSVRGNTTSWGGTWYNGTFGQGGYGLSGGYMNGGGGGWYGGGASGPDGTSGGGSGWAFTESNYTTWQNGNSSDANQYLLKNNTEYYLTNTQLIAGNQTFKAPNGSNETGHTGNGYARITYLGEE